MNKNIFAFKHFEKKWKNFIPVKKKGPFTYILEMLPYTSGSLHMGHVRNYTIGDVVARLKYLQGYCVFHPMGWDAFGLPAENAAREYHIHPRTWTQNNITSMREQLKALFFSYDWDYELTTCDASYYKHQQKLFIEMFKAGFIKKKEEYVNWDPVDETVLANEQVVDGKGWRSGAPVQKKLLSQWFATISDFSEILLEDLKKLEGHWPSQIITMQRNWIGKNEGYAIKFEDFEIFTKSPYFLPQVEFLAVAPDSPYGIKLYKKYAEVETFIRNNPRDDNQKDTRGVFTGIYVENPFNKIQIPVYVANYVLGDYGTGIVMGVPSICENDHNFAINNNLKIKYPINLVEYLNTGPSSEDLQLQNQLLKDKIVYEKTTYRLKDWCISRQRYWGTPIPIIYCEDCGILPNENLPIEVPENIVYDNHMPCPKCGKTAKKETDTMDTFVDSAWYFWRYPCAKSEKIFDDNLKNYPVVNLYIGGPEHAVLHLLFARFFGKVLKIFGYIEENEPFQNFYAQGMICMQTYKNKVTNTFVNPKDVEKDTNGLFVINNGTPQEVILGSYEKMSKSKKNTVSPQEILQQSGVDALRLFIVSDTPCHKDLQWNEKSLNGCWTFINRIWRITHEIYGHVTKNQEKNEFFQEYSWNIFFNIIKDFETISINVAIAQMRIFVNYVEDNKDCISSELLKSQWKDFLKLLWCICPVISMECLELLGDDLKFELPFSRHKIQGDVYHLVIQKDGKKIQILEVKSTWEEADLLPIILEKHPYLSGYSHIIFVKYKIMNFVFSTNLSV